MTELSSPGISIPESLGFIGTGAIAQAVITGLTEHAGFRGSILVSQRNETRSRALAKRYANLVVEPDNQDLVDRSEWVFISVLPPQAREIVSGLRFQPHQRVISFVAGMSVAEIKSLSGPVQGVHRMIPLPPVEFGEGPLPFFPPDPDVANLFGQCGDVIEVDSEDHFSTFSAASAVMAAHHQLTAVVATWIAEQGVPAEAAAAYATHLFHGLTRLEIESNAKSLQNLPEESLTIGGLNEQVLGELRQSDWFRVLTGRLDRIADRLSDQ